ncbi:MAG: histidinol-phosphate transaminase, partial [Oscillospiraceae bacterium]
AYVDFGAESAVPLVDTYDNLLVVGTFSKSRAMAGARLGYAVGNAQLIADLNLIKYSFNPYNLNRLTLAAGVAVLQDEAYFQECREKIIKTREWTLDAMRRLGFQCTDSLANFIFASHESMGAETLLGELRARGVLVRWFNQPRIRGHLRISIGTQAQMEKMVEIIQKMN